MYHFMQEKYYLYLFQYHFMKENLYMYQFQSV